MKTVSVIIPAAGCGARANLGGNKILAPLRERTVLEWTLDAFLQPEAMPENCALAEIIVAARPAEWPLIETIFAGAKCAASTCSTDFRLAHGGATRQDSVTAALAIARGDWIAIHDAARPLASPALIARVIAAALGCGGAIAALPVADTVKWSATSGNASEIMVETTLERARVHLAQTPQVFARTIFEKALFQAARDKFQGTDCASLVERARDDENGELYRVALVAGEANNFKITFADDLARAAQILDKNHKGEQWREQ